MIARLMCLLLGHQLDNLEKVEGVQAPVYVSHGKCARCGVPVITVRDLRDEESQAADDERSGRLQ